VEIGGHLLSAARSSVDKEPDPPLLAIPLDGKKRPPVDAKSIEASAENPTMSLGPKAATPESKGKLEATN